jgi:hypothetical protein
MTTFEQWWEERFGRLPKEMVVSLSYVKQVAGEAWDQGNEEGYDRGTKFMEQVYNGDI